MSDEADRVDPTALAQWRRLLGVTDLPEDPAGLIDLIRGLEDLKSCACAVQARATASFDQLRRAEEAAARVPSRRRGTGVAGEIALARRESPHRAQRLITTAKTLVSQMPATLDSLTQGRLNEWRAVLAVKETDCLSIEDRKAIDAQLFQHLSTEHLIGDAKLVAWLRQRSYALDPISTLRRASHAETQRHVSLRPAPDTMAWLTALLPLKQGVAAYAALSEAADTARVQGDERTRGQVMADTLTERVTGSPARMPAKIELVVEITDRALFNVTDEPAYADGHGPVPAGWVRQLVTQQDAEGQVAIRRLYRPKGKLIQLESASRVMPPGLQKVIRLRDRTCRIPYCDASIRHADHVVTRSVGGKTHIDNGQGLCEACNYAKQAPGWRAKAGYTPDGTHIVDITTPTGHTYRSHAPPAAS